MTERTRGPSAASGALRLLAMAIFGALAYVLFLVTTAPASIMTRVAPDLPQDVMLSGTIWHGAARFGNSAQVAWDFDAAASLAAFRPVFALAASAPDTRLTATAIADPLSRPRAVTLQDLRGRAGWSLVEALAPQVTIRCTPLATVALSTVTLREDRTAKAEGQVTTPAGTCRNTAMPDLAPVDVPPLLARATGGLRTVVTTQDAPEVPLAEATLDADARLTMTVHPEGARRVPGLPSAFPIILEMPLR